MIRGKRIVLGITGSIAAYKTPHLVRLLVKVGARVRVVLTRDAAGFVTPLTLSTVSGEPVLQEFSVPETGQWNNHVELGLWADLLLLAPLSANTMAKMANGICDNLLMAVYQSARCPVMVAPAMDADMWQHDANRSNLDALKASGVHVIAPATGELASGLVGEGRMEEPELICAAVESFFDEHRPLKGRRILVTAGPTFEKIDPVRFVGNRSSGKMGFALADAFAGQGGDVTLVTGPTSLLPQDSAVRRINVESAADMYIQCVPACDDMDIVVMCAAVADYTPAHPEDKKRKKEDAPLAIDLVPTADILAEMGRRKRKGQFLAGFALETDNELEHARAKQKRKNLDLVVLNSLNDAGAGFGHDTNKVTLISAGEEVPLDLMSKEDTARRIVEFIIQKIS